MRRLEGKRVAITGPRRAAELSKLVENLGGKPLVRPAQGTVFLDDVNLQLQIKGLLENPVDWIIFTTGIGAETLLEAASHMGQCEALTAKIKQAAIAARGYKTINVLKKYGIEPTVRDDDGTTAGIARAMAPYDLAGRRVVLQLYGETETQLKHWLRQQGAECEEVLPYRHVPPDPWMVETLIIEILRAEVDAVAFTTGPQVHVLFDCAREKGLLPRVLAAFEKQTLAVAVGKVTAEALRDEGVQRIIAPEEERMGSMIIALAQYYENQQIG
jgi:uroporphyrinogen-III synthase